MKPHFEPADIICRFGPAFEEQHRPPFFQQKALEAVSLCRTAAPGGQKQQCMHRCHEHVSYSSCRNHHCPKCQNKERELWIRQIRERLPPCRYFHVIFTLPSSLNGLFIAFRQEMQDILFQAAGQTLEQFAAMPAYPGKPA
ncbi:MAG: transposase zinc-binding domain-containing protein [Tannerella sp.]|nr:transposase zinc-binding domain-containing protein [Tannerella sp.]